MICTNCGYELPEGAVFCGNCGAMQNTVSEIPAQPVSAKKRTSLIPIIAGLSVLALGLVIAIIVALTSHGTGGSASAKKDKNNTGSSQLSSNTVPSDEPGNIPSDDSGDVPVGVPDDEQDDEPDNPVTDPWADAQTTFQRFAEELKGAADRNDRSALAAHFIAPEEYGNTVDELCNYLTSINTEYNTDYPYLTARVIQVSDQYGIGFIYRSVCIGAYPNEKRIFSSKLFPVSLQGGSWMIDYTDACCTAVDAFTLPYPEDALAAGPAGRKWSAFDRADLSWIFNDIVTPNSLNITLHAIWENEDGSVDCLLCSRNGTQQTRTINRTEVTIYQKDTGTELFNVVDTQTRYVAPGISITYIVHVPASQVNKSIDWSTDLGAKVRYDTD